MSVTKRVVSVLLLGLGLLGVGELAVRGYYFFRTRDVGYLTAPYGWKGRLPWNLKEYARYPVANETLPHFDPYAGRTLVFRTNSQGGRGPEWAPVKTPGTVRILAVGGSTTFGVCNPEEATWPVLLEEELRKRYGAPVEVLNGGRPWARLGTIAGTGPGGRDLISALSNPAKGTGEPWLTYDPDMVLYFEGFNNAPINIGENVEWSIQRFHTDSWLGKRTRYLYYRSMLYTYLLEKVHFGYLCKQNPVVPEIKRFRQKLRELVQLIRSRGAAPIFVLQTLKYDEVVPAFRALSLENDEEIHTVIESAMKAKTHDQTEPEERRMVYTAQAFVEVVRREAEAAGVRIIDPRPAFAAYEGQAPLFCDYVHLSDEGNKVLAREIARHLDPSEMLTAKERTR